MEYSCQLTGFDWHLNGVAAKIRRKRKVKTGSVTFLPSKSQKKTAESLRRRSHFTGLIGEAA
jgi:hypothetical protein